jgi:hypothetical protein
MDSTLNIKTTSEVAAIQELVKWLNTGDRTVNEVNKRFREMKSSSIIGSQGLKDLKDVQSQVAASTMTSNGKMMQSYFKTGEAIRSLQQIVLGLVAAYASLREAQEMAELAGRIEMLRAELQALGDKKNFNATELINQMSDAAGGSVTQLDLMQIALHAVRLGNIDLEKMPAIMAKIEHESKLAGIGAREMFDIFIRGAETGSAKFQVQFGLLYDVKKAEEEYAASVGTTAKDLSTEEQRMVKVNLAFSELLKRQEVATTDGEKTIERFEQLNSLWEKMKITLGGLIGVPLSKFLYTIAMDCVILAEGISSVYHTTAALVDIAIGAWKMKSGDTVGTIEYATAAEEHLHKIKSLGDEIRKQMKSVDDVWYNREPAKLSTGAKIGGTPKKLLHTASEAELKEQAKAESDYYKKKLDTYADYMDEVNKMIGANTEAELNEVKKQEKADIKYAKNMSERHKKAGKERIRINQDVGDAAFTLYDGMSSGFSNMAAQMSSAWQGMWARNIGNTQTLFAMLIQSIADAFFQLMARLAAMQIFSWLFPGFGGIGAVSSFFGGGGKASGGYVAPGQTYTVGEHGIEGLVMRPGGGGYVINNNNYSKMNQISQSSSSQQMQIQVIPIVEADKISVMVKYGNQLRSRRVI